MAILGIHVSFRGCMISSNNSSTGSTEVQKYHGKTDCGQMHLLADDNMTYFGRENNQG